MDAARLLIDKRADIDAICQIRAKDGLQANFTPLMLAAMWKHDGMVRLLLEKGARVSHAGRVRIERTVDIAMAAPHLSVMLGDKRVNRILKEADSMEAIIKAELTGLHLAVLLDDVAVIKSFLEHGADPDMPCQFDVEAKHRDYFHANFQVQLTPLHLAAWAGHETVAALLVDHGAEVNRKIQAGGTAALKSGAQINQEMQSQGTALHVAVGLRKEKVVRVLKENGADVGAKTRDGRTALQWADDQDGESTALKDMMKGFVRKLWRPFHDGSDGKGKKPKNNS
ncbi:ankyrin repeat-containing domain protein [Aspergillus cavernicola]|uniref:Ankyrin repeat-containing domain protein n=1 Tax=Aspergillus cavernicola TaxID=176166 RepID=A0ABR4IWI6_9EURO